MKYITDCPLCALTFLGPRLCRGSTARFVGPGPTKYAREAELVDHLRTDHHDERSAALADVIERTARQRRVERRRRARGGATTLR
jgi:hypothetical protein